MRSRQALQELQIGDTSRARTGAVNTRKFLEVLLRVSRVVLALICLLLAATAARAADQYLLLRLDGGLLKWGSPKVGTPATVRYAFVASAMEFPGAINCEAMVPLAGLLASSQLADARLREEVA